MKAPTVIKAPNSQKLRNALKAHLFGLIFIY